MKKQAVKYTIAEPCHESWSAMTPNEQGRFCQSCQKTVVDFTRMTDSEMIGFMNGLNESVCGRMTGHQLNREMKLHHVPVPNAFSLRALVLGTAITTFSAVHGHAQGRVVGKVAATKGEVQVEQVNTIAPITDTILPARDSVFSGMVLDYENDILLFSVEITIYDANGMELSTTRTGENGTFELPLDWSKNPYRAVFRKEDFLEAEYYFADSIFTRNVKIDLMEEPKFFMGIVAEPEF